MEPKLQHLQSEYHTHTIPDNSTGLVNTLPGDCAHHNIGESGEVKHVMVTGPARLAMVQGMQLIYQNHSCDCCIV